MDILCSHVAVLLVFVVFFHLSVLLKVWRTVGIYSAKQ
jgi:hypothetical protein